MSKIHNVIPLVLILITSSMSAQEVYVAKFKDAKECAVSFTFDDGNVDNYTIAAPELEKRGWRGTFWLNCSRIPGEINQRKGIMTWDDVSDLHSRGHEISNHGWDHRKLTKIPYEEAVREIEKNDSAIFAHLGTRPTSFCYPYNSRNDKIYALASKGRVGTRTFQYAFGEQSSDTQLRKRMQQTISSEEWAVWMTHGITCGYDYFKDSSRFTSFLDYVKERESQIWIGTFHDVAAYVAERNNIQLKVENKVHKIVVVPVINLDPELYDQPLTMIVETDAKIKVKQARRSIDISYRDGKAYFEFNPYGDKIRISLMHSF